MSLRTKLELNWQGKEYPLLVTMEVIDRVEDKISAAALLAQMSTGDVRLSHVAKFLALVLSEAGANVTQEQVYIGMFEDGEHTIQSAQEMVGLVASAFFPQAKKKEGKKPTKAKARAS